MMRMVRTSLWVVILVLFGMVACLSGPEAKSDPKKPKKAPTSRELADSLGITPDTERRVEGAARTGGSGRYLLGDLDITDLNGTPVSLKNLRGHWVLVDFFTTYSIPSQESMPVLDRIWRKYRENGLAVVGVSLDMQGAVMVKPFVEALGVTYPIYLATPQTREGQTPYGFIQEIPVTLLIGPDGKLVQGYLGAQKMQALDNDLRRAMKIK